MRLSAMPAYQLAPLLRKGEVSPVEVIRETIENIEKFDDRLNAHITVLREEALREARTAEKDIAAGNYKGLLHGIPYGVKDNIHTKGVLTTVGSRIYADHISSFDATVIERLRGSGAILVGKHNLYEFGFGASANPHYGASLNPWDPDRISGGSSTGSGVAVASRFCHLAIGSDTGGSIRIPAAMCGVVGFVATRGRISGHGVFQTSRSHDRVGPIARSVVDIAIALDALSGHDPKDEGSVNYPWTKVADQLNDGLNGLRVLFETTSLMRSSDEVRKAIERAASVLVTLGARVSWRELPCLERSRPAHRIISVSEAAAEHQQLLHTRRDDYGEKLRKRLEAGLALKATEYVNALKESRRFRTDITAVFQDCEVIATPTIPFTAPACGTDVVDLSGRRYSPFSLPVSGESMGTEPQVTDFTGPFSLVGLPAITMPCGFASGLPLAIQFVAQPSDDSAALKLAHAYESATSWHEQYPAFIEDAGQTPKEART